MSAQPSSMNDLDVTDPLVGRRIDERFEVLGRLGGGSAHGGRLYMAIQRPMDRRVVLKILPGVGVHGDARRRFLWEASVASRLVHPNVTRVLDYGITAEGVGFIAMPAQGGRTLRRTLHSEGRMSLERAVWVVEQIALGAAAAHDQGVLHRDLTPDHVILWHQGEAPRVQIRGFGLIKPLGDREALTGQHRVLGSPAYMPPEQVQSRELDARVDVYALGIILYELITGGPPFQGPSPVSVMHDQVHRGVPQLPENLDGEPIPTALRWWVDTCLQKEREARFGSVRELLRALTVVREVLTGERGVETRMTLADGVVAVEPGHGSEPAYLDADPAALASSPTLRWALPGPPLRRTSPKRSDRGWFAGVFAGLFVGGVVALLALGAVLVHQLYGGAFSSWF